MERVRRFALGLPEAWEDFPWGESVVKVGPKVFVFTGGDDQPVMTVKLAGALHEALRVDGVAPAGYGLGRHGWVSVPLGRRGPPAATACAWAEESYRLVAPARLVRVLDGGAPAPVEPSLNREWHAAHRLGSGASLEERLAWHTEHARVCGCRPVPPALAREMAARGTTI